MTEENDETQLHDEALKDPSTGLAEFEGTGVRAQESTRAVSDQDAVPEFQSEISQNAAGSQPEAMSSTFVASQQSSQGQREMSIGNIPLPPRHVRKPFFKDGRFWTGLVTGIVIGAIAGVGTLGGIAAYKVAKQNDAVAAEKAKLPDFKKIGNECIIGDEETELTAGSDGRSLSMFIPESNMYEGMKTQQCVNQQLHVPSGILSKMEQTSGLDGSQHDSWGNLEVTWSYNGNSGFRATYEVKEE